MFQFLVASAIILITIAQISLQQFQSSFKLLTGSGGCNRNSPNGVAIQPLVLQVVDDALDIATNTVDDLPFYQAESGTTGKRVRGLLYLLFGVNFINNNDLHPDDDSKAAYNYIMSTIRVWTWLKLIIANYHCPVHR